MTRFRTYFVLALCFSFSVGAALADGKPSLRTVAPIYEGLFAVAVADDIRKTCDDIAPRIVRAISRLQSLNNEAASLGYSRDEIDAFVNSDVEKQRMRARADAYYRAAGAQPGDPDSICLLGRTEIARNSPIGTLLRLK